MQRAGTLGVESGLGIANVEYRLASESVRNPYLSKAKKQLTIRLDEDTFEYFKSHRSAVRVGTG